METASTPLSAKRTSQLHFFHDSAQHWVYLHAVCAQEPPKQTWSKRQELLNLY